jgi:hypothetical protein
MTPEEMAALIQEVQNDETLSAKELHVIANLLPSSIALPLLHRALAKADDAAMRVAILTSLAVAHRIEGQFDESWKYSEEAVLLAPDNLDARKEHAEGLLLQRVYHEGFREFEARVGRDGCLLLFPDKPVWKAGQVPSRILILGEQGRGDQIQMIRFLEWEQFRGNTIIVECHMGLVPLFSRLPHLSKVVAWNDEAELEEQRAQPPVNEGEIDCQLPFLSLPYAVGADYSDGLFRHPYLKADPALNGWNERLRDPRLKVGLVWQGDPDIERDCYRSIPFDLITRLFGIDGSVIYNLVIEGEERKRFQEASGAFGNLIDPADHLTDYDQTAAVVSNLDIVISVDTSVAHLAGALGKPVWVPLSRSLEWRWGLEGETTPWYPTMRLLRQTELSRWESIVERLRDMLISEAATR